MYGSDVALETAGMLIPSTEPAKGSEPISGVLIISRDGLPGAGS